MTKIITIAQAVWIDYLRRKDVYVLLILLGALLVALVSLNIFGLGGMVRYVMDIGLLLSWVFGWILSIHIAVRELPQEEARGTIFPLLARPVTRRDVLLGKWLGTTIIAAGATLLFYLLVVGVVVARGGRIDVLTLLQGGILHVVLLGILTALALACSTRLHQDAAAALSFVLTGAAFLILPRVPALLVHERGAAGTSLLFLYHLLPHVELFDMRKRIVHDFGPVDWGPLALVACYGALWIALLLTLAWLSYRRKVLSRGGMYG